MRGRFRSCCGPTMSSSGKACSMYSADCKVSIIQAEKPWKKCGQSWRRCAARRNWSRSGTKRQNTREISCGRWALRRSHSTGRWSFQMSWIRQHVQDWKPRSRKWGWQMHWLSRSRILHGSDRTARNLQMPFYIWKKRETPGLTGCG